MILNQQKIVNEQGKVTGFLLKKNDFFRLQEYIEDMEDALELSEAIKNSEGFSIWDDFVKQNNLN
jgi:ABC-type lipoprotein release transport system permease subunit